jgi:hypothetical protein
VRPIFTIHAGEYLVGTTIEESFPALRVWIPSKDIGVDLLVTDGLHNKIASLQVKFSKDYLATDKRSFLTPDIRSGGWWTLRRDKILASPADLWVMVLYQFHSRKFDFVVIPPSELLARYDRIGLAADIVQSYIWVTSDGRCWETRGLGRADQQALCHGTFSDTARDLTEYLNVWPFAPVTQS